MRPHYHHCRYCGRAIRCVMFPVCNKCLTEIFEKRIEKRIEQEQEGGEQLMDCKILEYTERVSNDPEGTPYQSYGQLRKKCNCPDCIQEKIFLLNSKLKTMRYENET